MTKHGGNLFRSLITMALLLTLFWLGASRPAAAQGQGNGSRGGGGGVGTGWIEQFSDGNITSRGWGIEDTGSPDSQFGVPGVGVAKSFERDNDYVWFENGRLRLKLNLANNGGAWTSTGSMVYYKTPTGPGVYEWCAKMSADTNGNPLPGSVSAGFVYYNNSQTEVDFEQAHGKEVAGPNEPLYLWLYMANWFNRRLTSSRVQSAQLPGVPTPPPTYAEFKNYKFDWRSDSVEFLVNGSRVAFHTTNVPKTAGNVMMNHWGTNNPDGFGGAPQAGTAYYYVNWVRYTPPGAAVPSPGTSCPSTP